MKIYTWDQDELIGLYCPQCREGLGVGENELTANHLAHVHSLQRHNAEEYELEKKASQEEAQADAG